MIVYKKDQIRSFEETMGLFHFVLVILISTNVTFTEYSNRVYDILRYSSATEKYNSLNLLELPNVTTVREIFSFVSRLKTNHGKTPNTSRVDAIGHSKSDRAPTMRTKTISVKDNLDTVNSYTEKWVEVTVNHSDVLEKFDHFWESTGFCPPAPHDKFHEFLNNLDAQINLELIGSLPHDAIKYVRIHWLLDLVNASLVHGRPEYDFSHLDSLLDQLHRLCLRPGFEVMGNPGNVFDDFDNSTQVLWWRDLIRQLGQRYVDRYGVSWLNSWRWETWNEPDHKDFDDVTFTVPGFLNYFDATREGLDLVHPDFLLGGPGGSCREPSFTTFCYALLQHCQNGTSFFGGKKPRIDFLSFHKKGEEDADSITAGEESTILRLQHLFPFLRTVPVSNDEGDFLKGWWRPRAWRADARYSTLVVRSVASHHQARSAKPAFAQFELLSFDNAFLNYHPSYFNQRTLIARFQINNTNPSQVQVVHKPAYAVATLLAKLGNRAIFSRVGTDDPRLSVMSTCRNCASEERSRGERQGRTEQRYANTHEAMNEANKSIVDETDIKVKDSSETPVMREKYSAYYVHKDGGTSTMRIKNIYGGERNGEDEMVFFVKSVNRTGFELPERHEGNKKQERRARIRGAVGENVYSDYRDSLVIPKKHQEIIYDTGKNRAANNGVGRRRKGQTLRKDVKFTFAEKNGNRKKKAWESALIISFANNSQAEVVNDGQEITIKVDTNIRQGKNNETDGLLKEGQRMARRRGGKEMQTINNETLIERRRTGYRSQMKNHLKDKTGGQKMAQEKRSRKERSMKRKIKDSKTCNEERLAVILKLTFPPCLWGKTIYARHLSLGEEPGPYEVWRQQGSPSQPNPEQLKQMRAVQGSAGDLPFTLVAGPEPLHLALWIRLSSVHLLHMCLPFSSQPGQVRHLRALRVTSRDVLLSWSDEEIPTRCVLTYQVEKSDLCKNGPYRVINDGLPLLENNFLYSAPLGEQPGKIELKDCDNSLQERDNVSRNHYDKNKATNNSQNFNCSSECFRIRSNAVKGPSTNNRTTETSHISSKVITSFHDCSRSCNFLQRRILSSKNKSKSKNVSKVSSSSRYTSERSHKSSSGRKFPQSSRRSSTRRQTTKRNGGDVTGWYRVRVVTYWKSFGHYSEPVYYAGH